MKSAYKNELAEAAGVNYRTFQRWLAGNKKKLAELGARPRQQLLPPKLWSGSAVSMVLTAEFGHWTIGHIGQFGQ